AARAPGAKEVVVPEPRRSGRPENLGGREGGWLLDESDAWIGTPEPSKVFACPWVPPAPALWIRSGGTGSSGPQSLPSALHTPFPPAAPPAVPFPEPGFSSPPPLFSRGLGPPQPLSSRDGPSPEGPSRPNPRPNPRPAFDLATPLHCQSGIGPAHRPAPPSPRPVASQSRAGPASCFRWRRLWRWRRASASDPDPTFLGARNILGSSLICQQPRCSLEIQGKQLCGCGLLGVGIWLSVSQGNFATFSPSFPSLSAANLVIAIGTIVMVTGFLGCLGAIKENRCLLLSFFIVLLIILLAELILIILFFVYMDKVNENARKDLKEGLLLYNSENNVGLKNAWNIIQAEMHCCGVTDYTDWYPVLGENTVPDRCCMENSQGCGRNSTTPLWKTGCYEKVKMWFDDNKHVLGTVGMCILIMQILGMAFSMTLFQHIHRTGKKYDA
uniref:Tetraspanin-9 n=1 Tax=Sus scrofa TaxID=9823 RepID=A0A8D1QJV1_PIG